MSGFVSQKFEGGTSTAPKSQPDVEIPAESSIEKKIPPQAGSSVLKRRSKVSEEKPPRKKLKAVKSQVVSHDLMTAVRRNDKSAVRNIIRSNRDLIDIPDTIWEQTPLHHAASKGCLEILKELIAAGANVNVQSPDGDTPLHSAAMGKNVEIVKTLLTAGANTRCQDYLHHTPLHVSLNNRGNEDIAELIANFDPQNSLQDRDGYSPLHFAALKRRAGVVKTLLAAGASTRCLDCRHRTPLNIALRFQAEDIAELISDRDPKNSVQDINGCTPLHHAARNGYVGVARKLLAAGVNTCVQDNQGRTPLHYAVESGSSEMVELISDVDPGNNLQDKSGNTPLHSAVEEGVVDVVRNVLFSRVHPHLLNNKGHSPLDIVLTTSRQPTGIITQMIASMCALREVAVDWKNTSGWKVDVEHCMKLVAECEVEVQRLKETKVNNSTISYHDVARQKVSKVAAYLRNEDIRNELLNGKTAQSFPNYAELITVKLEKAERRRVLTESSFVNFALLSRHLSNLPETCIDNIFSYFNELEMQNFVKVVVH